MGSSESKVTPPAKVIPDYSQDTYKWPDNLYIEIRDMASVSFLVYTFGYIRAGLRHLDETNQKQCHASTYQQCTQSDYDAEHHIMKSSMDLTPVEVKNIISENENVLAKKYKEFRDGAEELHQSLDMLIRRAYGDDKDESKRPLTVKVYDDEYQTDELVYGICKDDINRRITLVFRGTDNALAFRSNWLANFEFWKTSFRIPRMLEGKIGGNKIWFHEGFYEYVRVNETVTKKDGKGRTKYDQIVDNVRDLSRKNPDYRIYVTGHSLGGALSGMVAFFLSLEGDLPKPITCINFASPRLGDYRFLEACQVLEREKMLRYLRVVNKNDTIAAAPTLNYYHAGFQVMLYAKNRSAPLISYPNLKDGIWAKTNRAWQNSWLKSLNLGYDHGEYRQRVEDARMDLEKYDLNKLYADGEMTGFF